VTRISGLRVCDIHERDVPLVPTNADRIGRIFKDTAETFPINTEQTVGNSDKDFKRAN